MNEIINDMQLGECREKIVILEKSLEKERLKVDELIKKLESLQKENSDLGESYSSEFELRVKLSRHNDVLLDIVGSQASAIGALSLKL